MPLKTDIREIDGDKYFTTQLRPLKAIKLFTKVTKTLGPSLKGLMATGQIKTDSETDLAATAELFAEITANLDEDKVENLIESCLLSDCVHKNGKVITNIDIAFDNPITILKVVVFVLEVNFKDFLGDLGISKIESPES